MTSSSHPFCIATIVTDKAIAAMLDGSGSGSYRDTHPWLVAADMLLTAHNAEQRVPILFAVTSKQAPMYFSHWSVIKSIDVVELHRGQWDTRCAFDQLRAVNPIFEAIDSVIIKASAEQMEREMREGIKVSRKALDEHHIHPYAICETPPYVIEAMTPAAT